MEFFASNETVEQLQADLAGAQDEARLPLALTLAWQLRQRDCQRALQLAAEVESLCDGCISMQHALQTRVGLIRGEVKWLFGELGAAQALAMAALQNFAAGNDPLGSADAHWLLAWIALDQGDWARNECHLEAMETFASGSDTVRLAAAQATLARFRGARDGSIAKARQGECFADAPESLHPAARCQIELFWNTAAFFASDFVRSVRHAGKAYALALACGQIRAAIITATFICINFNKLNDYHTALEWVQRALALARQHGWPNMVGTALAQSAETLCHLQRHDTAHELLCEAVPLMAPMANSDLYAIALKSLGTVELARQQYASALHTFQLLAQHGHVHRMADLEYAALRGQAQALLELGQPQSALQAAGTVLTNQKALIADRIDTLCIMAAIHARHALPAPAGMDAPSAPLHYLQQALMLAQNTKDLIIPGQLLENMGHEYAKLGQFEQAWQLARQASSAREKIHSREANDRAQAMQLSHATEKARLDAEQQRKTSATLTHLGTIGQEITACLQTDAVYQVLSSHVHRLLRVDAFAIWLLDADARILTLAYGIEDGKELPPIRKPVSDPNAPAARCVRERQEILLDYDIATEKPFTLPGTRPTASVLYAPLFRAAQIVGAISVQAFERRAYGEREQLIFRTLCAYTAIALANANAHRQLQENQQQMVLQEKMAGLGTLTAGIAHEINNPTNFVHVAAQNQREEIAEFAHFVDSMIEPDDAHEIVQEFRQRFARLNQNVTIMLNGTVRIKGIVRDLRAFTRLDEAERKAVRISGCLESTLNLVRTSWLEKVEFMTEFRDDPEIECWPALLNQVFMNLLINACQAIEAKQQALGKAGSPALATLPGRLWLRLSVQEDMLRIEIEDNGIGMDDATRARIMEPFYTTKEVGQGTGLGLSIAFGIIEKHGGKLGASSKPGLGSCFTIALPLAPVAVPPVHPLQACA